MRYILSVLLITFVGCNANKESETEYFSHFDKNITNIPIIRSEGFKEFPLIPDRVWAMDSILITYERSAGNGFYFSVFSLISKEKLQDFGKPGSGPGETAMANMPILDKVDRSIYLPADDKKLIFKFELDSALILGTSYHPVEYYKTEFGGLRAVLENQLFLLENPYPYFLFDSLKWPAPLLNVVEVDRKKSTAIGSHLFDREEFADHVAAMGLLMGGASVNAKNRKLVFTYIHWNAIVIVDIDTGKQKVIREKQLLEHPQNQLKKYIYDLNCNYGYFHTVSTDDFIISTYWGVPRSRKQNGKQISQLPQHLHIYDWNGKPVADVKLDFQVRSIDVDETTGKIYLMDASREDDALVVINLKDIF
jgi:hypothetical protein